MAAGTVTEGDSRSPRQMALLRGVRWHALPARRLRVSNLSSGGFSPSLPAGGFYGYTAFEAEGTAAPPVYTVPCKTPRRRAVGEVDVYLVDFLGYFRRAATGRSPLTSVPLLAGETVVRPILAVGDDPGLQDAGLAEYWTAQSEQGEADAGAAECLNSWPSIWLCGR